MSERNHRPLLGLVVFIVIVVFGFGVCVAVCNDDDDDDDSMPAVPSTTWVSNSAPTASSTTRLSGSSASPLLSSGAPLSSAGSDRRDRDRGGDDRSDGKNAHGKCENARQCQDDDFSPSFDNSPVVICVQPGACDFGKGEQAMLSLVPPNPQKLVEAITAGSQAIGKSAGEMAGAIAALPIAILL